MAPRTAPKGATGNVNETVGITLSTLATKTGILSVSLAMTRGGKIISSNLYGGLEKLTEGEGPLMWGVMPSDLTLAELEAWIELSGPLTPTDTTSVEIASRGRKVQVLGVLGPGLASTQISMASRSMRGLRWAEASETTTGWTWWIYNTGAALTTGAIFRLQAQHFVEWNPSG